jgi:hypothetical protein
MSKNTSPRGHTILLLLLLLLVIDAAGVGGAPRFVSTGTELFAALGTGVKDMGVFLFNTACETKACTTLSQGAPTQL